MPNWGGGLSGAGSGAAMGTAIMPGWGTAIGGLIGGLGGLFSGGDQGAGDEMIRQMLSELQQAQREGRYNVPAALQSPSAFGNIQIDPSGRNQQVDSMNYMRNIGQQGGMDAQAQSSLAQGMGQANDAYAGRTGAIRNQQQMQGLGQGGLGLATQMMASQGAASQQNQAGLGAAGGAQQRALSAMMNAGGLGGQIRSQDWGEAAQRAQASDAVNRFNTENLNQGRYYNSGMGLSLLDRINSARGGNQNVAQMNYGNAQHTRDIFGGMGQGLGNVIDGARGAFGNQGGGGWQGYDPRRHMTDPTRGYGGGAWGDGSGG